MACSILLIMSAIFKYKEMSLAKLFKNGGVMISKTNTNRKITKAELSEKTKM